jgi:signal transduction histidine kinase
VLPQLHAAMLTLSGRASGPDPPDGQAVAWLADAHRRISDLLRDMPAAASPEVARLGLVGALRQAVADEFGAAFDRVTWQVEPEAEEAMCSLPSLVAEVLFYAAREALRNAARYGRGGDPSRPLHLAIRAGGRFPSVDGSGAGLELRIEDDGVGLSPDAGAEAGGHGLALHSTMLAVVGGSLSVESVPGAYTRVSLSLPLAVTSGSHDHELDTSTSHLSSPQK